MQVTQRVNRMWQHKATAFTCNLLGKPVTMARWYGASECYYRWHELVTLTFYHVTDKCQAPITLSATCVPPCTPLVAWWKSLHFLRTLGLSYSWCYCTIDVSCYQWVPCTIIMMISEKRRLNRGKDALWKFFCTSSNTPVKKCRKNWLSNLSA